MFLYVKNQNKSNYRCQIYAVKYNISLLNVVQQMYKVAENGNSQVKFKCVKMFLK